MTMRNELEVGPRLTINKSGYWSLVWAEKGGDGKWRPRSQSCHTKDRKLAEGFRRAYVAADSVPDPEHPPTVADLIEEYRADARDRDLSPGQFAALVPIERLLGSYRPEELTPVVIRAYRQQRNLAPGTLRRELGALLAALNYAVKATKHLTPAQMPMITLPPMPQPKEVFLDETETARLWSLAAADTGPDGRMSVAGRFVCMALGTGARKGVLEALTWKRVDMKTGTIDLRIPGVKASNKRQVARRVGKQLLPVLTRMHAERGDDRLVIGASDIRWPLQHFLDRYPEFKHVTAHVFRHTFITLGLRAGVSIWDMSGLVGASPAMLQTVYGHHVADSHLKRAADQATGWAA